jgi:hypothetical protein
MRAASFVVLDECETDTKLTGIMRELGTIEILIWPS